MANWRELITPYSIILTSLLVGLVAERVVAGRLRDLIGRLVGTPSQEKVFAGMRGAVVLWCVITGIYGALRVAPLPAAIQPIAIEFLRVNLIISVTWVLMRLGGRVITMYLERSGGALSETSLLTNLIRALIAVIGTLVVLEAIGISIAPILTTLGVGGIAVALALQDTLANLFAGVYILLSNKIRVGDQVRLASGEEGEIYDINWRNTAIKGPTGNLIIVPNATVASVVTTNFNLPGTETSVVATLGVSYDSDLEQVERICQEVARAVQAEVEGGDPTFEPLVRFNNFGELRVGFSVIMRAQNFGSQFLMRHEFFKRVHRRLREEGIAFDPALAMRDTGSPRQ